MIAVDICSFATGSMTEFGGMVTILRVTVNKFETETVNEYVLILLYQC